MGVRNTLIISGSVPTQERIQQNLVAAKREGPLTIVMGGQMALLQFTNRMDPNFGLIIIDLESLTDIKVEDLIRVIWRSEGRQCLPILILAHRRPRNIGEDVMIDTLPLSHTPAELGKKVDSLRSIASIALGLRC